MVSRSAPLLLGLLLLPASAAAMGSLGGDAAITRLPEPSIDYRVRVTDSAMNAFEVTKASFDGHIYLTGALGKAKVSIPFERIRRVLFEPLDGAEVLAVVTLSDGTQQTLHVRGKVPCFGLASFGNVSIEVADLRDVEVLGKVGASAP